MFSDKKLPLGKKKKMLILFFLLICLYLSPFWLGIIGNNSPVNRWSSVHVPGPHSLYVQEFSEEKKNTPIDIVFVGSSTLWTSYDFGYMQKRMSELSGRDFNLFGFGASWRFENKYITLVKDLLESRKVKLLIFAEARGGDYPEHPRTKYWTYYLREYKDFFGFPLKTQIAIYFQSVFGSVRSLLGSIRSNDKYGLTSSSQSYLDTMNNSKGALKNKANWNNDKKSYQDLNLEGRLIAKKDLFYSGKGNHPRFSFDGYKLATIQEEVLKVVYDLCQKYDTKLVIISNPEPKPEISKRRIRKYNTKYFGGILPIISPLPSDLYSDFSEEKMHKIYYSYTHPNYNGSEYHAKSITDSIYEVYNEVIKN